MKSRFVSLAGAFALLATSSVVAQDEGKITEGRLDAIGADGRPLGLKHTSVEAEISGTLARARPSSSTIPSTQIEAIYVFPLHQESAVDDMTMTVGDRVVKGVIKERGEAKRITSRPRPRARWPPYSTRNGRTSSPSRWPTGQAVSITIRYSQTMAWRTGGSSSTSRRWSGGATSGRITGATRRVRGGAGVARMPSLFRRPHAPAAGRRRAAGGQSRPGGPHRPGPMPTASPRRWWRRDTAPDTTSRSRSESMPARHGSGP